MKKFFILMGCALGLFFVEFFCFNFIGEYFMPNLLVLLIIYTALEIGAFEAVGTALWCGFIKDSYGFEAVPVYMISFFFCAISVLFIKKWIYHEASRFSRLIVVLVICILNFTLQFLLHVMHDPINFFSALKYIFFPEIIITLLIATWFFKQIKKCVLKLSV